MGLETAYKDEYNEEIFLLKWADEMVQRDIRNYLVMRYSLGVAYSAKIDFSFKNTYPQYPQVEFGVLTFSCSSRSCRQKNDSMQVIRFDGAEGIGGSCEQTDW